MFSEKNQIYSNYVVFSAFSNPEDVVVHKSIQHFSRTHTSIVITANKFSKKWKGNVDIVFVTRRRLPAKIKKIFKVLLNRSMLLRKFTRIVFLKYAYPLRWVLMPPHNARHFESIRAIKDLPENAWVYLVDSRDLVFQISPAEITSMLDPQIDLHFFDEGKYNFKSGEIQRNSSSPANWNWALMLLNHDLDGLKSIKDKWIINSGCIAGKKEAILKFLELSCEKLSQSLYSVTDLLDQASTNYVVYNSNDEDNWRVHSNGAMVLNMCGKIDEEIKVDTKNLTISGKVIPIVHQFDRYGTWNVDHGFTFNKRDY